MHLSIIIPALNEEKFIEKLLLCLKNQTFQQFEIIVADAKSTDNTVKIAKKYGARIVDGGHQSFGRNNGAKHAKYNTLLFLDADVAFKNDFLEKSVAEFEQTNADLACCYFDASKFSFEMKMVYETWNRGKFIRSKTKLPDGEGQCLWIKKDVFTKIGGFDENLKISEDVDLIQRAVSKDYHFEMLSTRFVPSPRRYKNVSILRVILGSLIGGIEQLMGRQTTGRFAQLIYGGWGIYNNTKKSSK